MEERAWETVAAAIQDGDIEAAVAALEPLGEAERGRLAARARRATERFGDADRRMPYPPVWPPKKRTARALTAEAAVLGTSPAATVARQRWRWAALRDEDVERLLRCRSRAWRQQWAETILAREGEVLGGDWRVVHRMVRDGLIDRPELAGYVAGAVSYFAFDLQGTALAVALRSEPEWLEHDLPLLFEIEQSALTSFDTHHWQEGKAASWSVALRELAEDGTVSRDWLLDASLGALQRDFSSYNARWYHKFHEALEPTPEEHLARLDDLLALLAAPDPAVVSFSLRALAALERKRVLPADRVLGALAPALLVPVKGHATRAVKLTGRVLAREPDAAALAIPALTGALAHESRDVQELALELLERHAGALREPDREQLGAMAAHADPAVRPRLEALAGAAAPPAGPEAPAGPAVAVPGRRPPAPRKLGEPLRPPEGLEELLERIAVALERGDDPDEIELLLDGISRMRALAVPEGRANALADRARTHSPPYQDEIGFHDARAPLSLIVLRWIGGRDERGLGLQHAGRSPREAIALRVRELAADLRGGKPRPLLCPPTHPGGWIDPDEAVRRVAALDGARPLELDLAQCVLRLGPDRDGAARDAAGRLKGEAASVLALALGGAGKRPRLSRLKAAWAAAEHARDPAAFVLPDLPRSDPNAIHASYTGTRHRDPLRHASPADVLALEESWWSWEPNGTERWLATVWPANREPAMQIVTRRLWVNQGTREYGIADVVEFLLDPAEPVGEEAALALALSLGSADAQIRAVAADVAIEVLRDRRLDGAALGDALAVLLREQESAVPARWADGLEGVAGAGPLTAFDVQAALERVVAAAGGDDRRRLLGVVELLRRLATEADAAIADERARDWLSTLGKGSKIGRAGREALAVTGNGAARSRAAVAELEG